MSKNTCEFCDSEGFERPPHISAHLCWYHYRKIVNVAADLTAFQVYEGIVPPSELRKLESQVLDLARKIRG